MTDGAHGERGHDASAPRRRWVRSAVHPAALLPKITLQKSEQGKVTSVLN